MTVDGAIVHIDLIVIGRVHQGAAAFHHARAACQSLQDQKLGDGELHQGFATGEMGFGVWHKFAIEPRTAATLSLPHLTLFLGPLSKTHSGTPAVFLDELDSSRFQGVLQPIHR